MSASGNVGLYQGPLDGAVYEPGASETVASGAVILVEYLSPRRGRMVRREAVYEVFAPGKARFVRGTDKAAGKEA